MQLISKNNKYKKVKRFQGGDPSKIRKLHRLERKSKEYKDTYKDIAGKGTIVTQDNNNKALYAGELDEVTVRPSNYDKGKRFGREVINSTNETGKQMAPILGGMMIAPFAIGGMAANIPATIGGMIGDAATQGIVRGTTKYDSWGDMLHDKTGLHPFLAELVNPGAWAGGIAAKPVVNGVKSVASKVVPKKRFGNVYTKEEFRAIGNTEDNIKAFEEALDKASQNILGGDKFTLKDPSKLSQIKINPDIENRLKALGLDLNWYSQKTVDNVLNTAPELLTELRNGKTVILANRKNKTYNPELVDKLTKELYEGDYGGLFGEKGNLIVRNSEKPNLPYSKSLIRRHAAHEFSHKIFKVLGIKPDEPTGAYQALNEKHPVGKLLNGLLEDSDEWFQSGEDFMADLWSWRSETVGFKELTEKEIAEALRDPMIRRHFKPEVLTNNLDEVKKAIKMLSLIPIGNNNIKYGKENSK